MDCKILPLTVILLLVSFSVEAVDIPWNGDWEIKGEKIDLAPFLPYFPSLSPWDLKGEISPQIQIHREGKRLEIKGELLWDKFSLGWKEGRFLLSSPSLEISDISCFHEEGEWSIEARIKTPHVEYEKIILKNVDARLRWSQKGLVIESFKAEMGEGNISLKGIVILLEKGIPLSLSGRVERVQLSKLLLPLPYPLAGILDLKFKVSGKGKEPSSLNGWAKMCIEEGNLGELPLLLNIFSLIFTGKPKKLSLDSMEGTFRIDEGYAYTSDAVVKGKGVSISAKGYIGWTRKVDLTFSLYLSQEILKFTPLTRMVGILIDELGNALIRVKMTGTITNPRYTLIPLSWGEMLGEGLERIFRFSPPREKP